MDLEKIKKFTEDLDFLVPSLEKDLKDEARGPYVKPDPQRVYSDPEYIAETFYLDEPPKHLNPSNTPVGDRSAADQLFSRKLITELDRYYHTNEGAYPTLDYLRKKFPKKDIEAEIKQIQQGLMGRGLPRYRFPQELDDPNELDPNFVLAVTMICNFADKRSKEAKLKDIGISSREWAAYLKQKKHKAYFNQRLNDVFSEDVLNDAKVAIARGVEAGDLQAVKYYHEYSGEYRPQDMQIQNLQMMVVSMMEILAKYVSGEVLITVAEELDKKVNLTKLKELAQ